MVVVDEFCEVLDEAPPPSEPELVVLEELELELELVLVFVLVVVLVLVLVLVVLGVSMPDELFDDELFEEELLDDEPSSKLVLTPSIGATVLPLLTGG